LSRRHQLRRRGSGSRLGRTLPAVVLLLVVSGCGERDKAPVPASRPNLLLITMDTTRADRLGCYGGPVETPVLDRLARDGARFENAFSTAPLTLPSHASILTGLYPPSHGVRENTQRRLPEPILTLAEHLRQNGYRTGAAVSAYVLSSVFGTSQGFEFYDEPRGPPERMPSAGQVEFRQILERPAGKTAARALELLERFGDGPDRPFFLWVHFFDPHSAYEPPEPFSSRYRSTPYDGEIAYMDQEIGSMLEGLARMGRERDTLVAVTADHGESLGEHGENTHGLFVYDATIRVPLILNGAGRVPEGRVIRRLVSLVDLAPSLLELAGAPPLPTLGKVNADGGNGGRSFAPLLDGRELPERAPVYAESELPLLSYGWAPLLSLRDAGRLFVRAPRLELYNRSKDPGEERNLAAIRPEEARDRNRRLDALLEQFPEPPPVSETGPPAGAPERLMSLGYIGGGKGATGAALPDGRRPERPDPKDRVGLHNELLESTALLALGERAAAADRAASVLKKDPDNPGALALVGVLATAGGDAGRGIEALVKALDRAPDNLEIRLQLANALHGAGRLEEAAELYRVAVERQPEMALPWYGYGNVLAGLGRNREAENAYRRSLALEPEQPGALAALGVVQGHTGDLAAGRKSLEAAVRMAPGMAGAWNHLGVLAEKMGDLEQARSDYRKVLELDPEHGDALFNAAKVALRMGDLDEAKARLAQLVRHHPDYPYRRFLEEKIRERE